jgi:hypothetical protein
MGGKMKGRSLLLVLGVAFVLGVDFSAAQFLARAQSLEVRPDFTLARIRVSEISVGILVCSVVRGLLGGFGAFLLFLYSKIRELENEVKELQSQNRTIGFAESLDVRAIVYVHSL